MIDTINGRTPEEIYRALRCVITQINDDCEDACDSCKNCPNNFDGGRRELAVHLADAIVRIQQLERERDAAVEAAKAKPFTWEEAIQDDCFLEIKDDEYIDAALNIFASSHDEFDEEDHISYLTNDTPEDEILILYRGDYNRKWRCWPRRPTDEERAAAKWEVE